MAVVSLLQGDDDGGNEAPGGIKGAYLSLAKKWEESGASAMVNTTRSYTWWMFKKAGSYTWMIGTTALIVVFPLILEIEREQQIVEMEQQQRQQMGGAYPQFQPAPYGAPPADTPPPNSS